MQPIKAGKAQGLGAGPSAQQECEITAPHFLGGREVAREPEACSKTAPPGGIQVLRHMGLWEMSHTGHVTSPKVIRSTQGPEGASCLMLGVLELYTHTGEPQKKEDPQNWENLLS